MEPNHEAIFLLRDCYFMLNDKLENKGLKSTELQVFSDIERFFLREHYLTIEGKNKKIFDFMALEG